MKIRISLITMLAVFALSVNAAVVTRTGSTLSFEGDMGPEYKNAEVGIQILGPFDEQKNAEESVFKSTGSVPSFMSKTYINTVSADEDGKYTFSHGVETEDKYYTVLVKEPCRDKVYYSSIYVPAAESETSFLKDINAASNAAAMREVFNNAAYSDILSGNRSDFSGITDETYKNKLAAEMAKGVPYSDFKDFEDKLTSNCAVLLTNTAASASDARELGEDKVDLSSFDLYDTYDSFPDGVRNAVFARMLNSDFSDMNEYRQKFNESVFLEDVVNEKYASNMTALLTSNKDIFGFDLTDYQKYADKVNKKLYGNSYSDMSAFKTALSSAVAEAAASSNTNSAGGGGGGGTSGGSGGSGGGKMIPTGNMSQISETIASDRFNDLDGVEWAKTAINKLAERGVVSGKGEGRFAPKDNIKREEFVQMIVKAFALQGTGAEIDFKDIDENGWYYGSVKTAYSLGIINGTGDGNFGIGKLITRQDMAAIILRAAKMLGKNLPDQGITEYFSDDADIADYAEEAVYTLRNAGIISGLGENRFGPKNNATRAQAAVMIYALYQK